MGQEDDLRFTVLDFRFRVIAVFLLVLVGFSCVWGEIITVDDDGPADFATIQAGIDEANDGDVVVVRSGRCTGEGNCDIDFKGKAITVKSENGPQNCIIDCNGTEAEPHRGFYFHSGEDQNSIIEGFTIINGQGLSHRIDTLTYTVGGGILCDSSSPKVSHCIFKYNDACNGAGIFNYKSSPIIFNCIFTTNSATWQGAAILNYRSSPVLKKCIITDNSVQQSGGGIGNYDSNLFLTNCIVADNTATYYAGGIKNNHSSLTLIN
ncbi:MAG: right-handed parallel beta-helix repeat-containing protein, partial [Planctomycetota bacterium]